MENVVHKFKFILFNPFVEDYKLYISCEAYLQFLKFMNASLHYMVHDIRKLVRP